MNELVESLIELSKEIEAEDPIDWADLPISEDSVYSTIALSTVEAFDKIKDPNTRSFTMLATITKLVAENFVLNLKLQREYGKIQM
ncbi:MAG: hypothetical protein EBY22_02890 [Gammaproteobacteria bacterium]|nr:hypothetical protein [Gammaproteobacteria bacterium]